MEKTLLTYFIVRKIAGFRWSADNVRLGLSVLALTAVVFGSTELLPTIPAMAIGTMATLGCGFYCLRVLLTLLGPDHALLRKLPWPLRTAK